MHVLAMEYPGYGIYPGSPTAEGILEDAMTVWEYLTQQSKLSPKDIILFGRSLGTGVATELAAHVQPCALLLMTAYTSIRNVVSSLAGKLAAFLIYERLRSIDNIKEVKCPTFLIHGQRDSLILSNHS
jgi:pimeloyl-ACP methyl ester carboxylesterase